MSLASFRSFFLEQVLDLLWRQWSSLGVTGQGARWHGSPIDPEALLLLSCTMARNDARLFDAMLEWMAINGRYINVQRLKRMLSQEDFAGEGVFRAVAATVKDSVSVAKWGRSAVATASKGDPEPLFYLKDGRPLPVVGEHDAGFAAHGLLRDRFESRGIAGPFRPRADENLILKLRALFGVNARCEIMAFLLLNRRGSPRAVARQTYYFPATITKAMAEMRDSGYLSRQKQGRHRFHSLIPELWRELLLGESRPTWIVWPRLFSALDTLWLSLGDEGLYRKSALAQSSSLRRVLLGSVVDKLETCMIDYAFGDVSEHTGEALLPFFVQRLEALLRMLASRPR